VYPLPAVLLAIFAVVMAIPLLSGLWKNLLAIVHLGVSLVRQASQAARPVASVTLADSPLRPQLSCDMRQLASETRSLVASLEHASRASTGWRDQACARPVANWAIFVRDEDYRPTIGVTGEVWAWLRSAEMLLDGDEPEAHLLEPVAQRVRAALFRDGPVGPRLVHILHTLVTLDDDLRVSSTSAPYRDRPPLRTAPLGRPDEQADDEANSYARALVRCERRIQRIARRYAATRASAEDLAQDIRLAAWTARARYRGDASIDTYILRIARYRAVSHARRERSCVTLGEQLDASPGPEALMEHRARGERVSQALRRLPDAQRVPLELAAEGHSYREISDALGISTKATSVSLSRARTALRRLVGSFS